MSPLARALRQAAAARNLEARLTLMLTPSQFATGREAAVVRRWDIFDRVFDVSRSVRTALRLSRIDHEPHASVIHLGGDPWFSARIAASGGLQACAVAETGLIARRHNAFARIFAVSSQVGDLLRARGVPSQKIVVSGDPRADAVGAERSSGLNGMESRSPTIGLLPGSRDGLFEHLVPYFAALAEQVVKIRPGAAFRMVISEFLSPRLVQNAQAQVRRGWPDLNLTWVTGGGLAALAESDLVITIPGTNTLELAMLGVPFAVLVDLTLAEYVPLEGLLEWISRIPVLGRRLRRTIVRKALTRVRYVALPNMLTGTDLVPEWIGTWDPRDLAQRVTALLDDRERRSEMRNAFHSLAARHQGASNKVAETAVELAGLATP